MTGPPIPTPDYALLDRAGAAAVFFPRPDDRPPPPDATDHRLTVAPGLALAARFYLRDPALPTLLYFHGNGEVVSDHDALAPLYHQAGLNLFVAEFRGYGRSDGHPSLAHLIADGPLVAQHFHTILDTAGLLGPRFLMGRSLGSQPALEIAARTPRRFRGLAVESGAAGMRRFLDRLGLPHNGEAATLVAQHEAKIRTIRLPALLIHGEQDDLVPLAQAAELYDLLSGAPRRLVVIPAAGHNDLLWCGRAQYFESIARLVRENP